MNGLDRSARWQGIDARVMILVAWGLMCSLATLGFVSWRLLARVDAEVVRQREGVAAALAGHLDARLTTMLASLQFMASAARAPVADGHVQELAEPLRQTYLQSGAFDALFVAGADGTVLLAEPSAWSGGGPLPVSAAVLRGAAAGGRPWVSNLLCGGVEAPDVRTSAQPCVVLLLVPVTDYGNRIVGAIGGALDASGRRFAEIAQASLGRGLSPVRLVDARDRVLASSPPGEAGTTHAGSDAVAVVTVPIAAWRVAAGRTGGPHAARSTFLSTLAWLGPALAGLALLFAWGAGRSVRTPLLELTDIAERIAGGDLDVQVPARGSDEVGRLARAFERMRVALKGSLDEIAAANEALERRVAARTRELADANRQLQERERLRQQLLRKVISAQEDERKRIARELHDETCQTLTALGVRLDLAQAAGDADARREVGEARQLATRSLDEVRRLMHDLRPSVLDDLGMVSAIRWTAERQLVPRGISVRFESVPLDARLPYEMETALFRASQEILTNIARHADAEHVLIQIGPRNGRVVVEIEDDGCGFEPAQVRPAPGDLRGLGLMGIRERVELFDGQVTIDSAPGRGTRVEIAVPLPRE